MKVNVHGKTVSLKYTLKKGETYKIDKKENIQSLTIFRHPQVVRGITNETDDGFYVFFVDYDKVLRSTVERQLRRLATVLPPIYLFTTKEKKLKDGDYLGNYHGESLGKLTPAQVVEYLRWTTCDNAYPTMAWRSICRSWVLRRSGKIGSGRPTFLKIIGDKNLDHEISTPHLKELEALYPEVPNIDYKRLDGLNKIYANEYETGA